MHRGYSPIGLVHVTIVVLRGPAGAGKSALAERLRERMGYPTAAVDTDVFNWQFVPGESNKAVVFENMRLVAESYLLHGYQVIVSGLILTGEEAGTMAKLRSAARADGEMYVDCYCAVPVEVAVERAEARDKMVPIERIREWWGWAEADRADVAWPLHQLDLTRPLADNVDAVLALLR